MQVLEDAIGFYLISKGIFLCGNFILFAYLFVCNM